HLRHEGWRLGRHHGRWRRAKVGGIRRDSGREHSGGARQKELAHWNSPRTRPPARSIHGRNGGRVIGGRGRAWQIRESGGGVKKGHLSRLRHVAAATQQTPYPP